MIIAEWIYEAGCVTDAATRHRGVAHSDRGTAIGEVTLITIRVRTVAIVINDAVREPAAVRRAKSHRRIPCHGAIHQCADVRRAAAVNRLAIASQEAVINL